MTPRGWKIGNRSRGVSWSAPAERSDDGALETNASKAVSRCACHRTLKPGGESPFRRLASGLVLPGEFRSTTDLALGTPRSSPTSIR
jgi:hypothetical protein